MEVICNSTNCNDKNSVLFLNCSGICDKVFHPKCIGLTQNFADKISCASSGIHWYCVDCRQISLSALSFKLSLMGQEFSKLTSKFLEVSSKFSALHDMFSKLSDFPNTFFEDSSSAASSPKAQKPYASASFVSSQYRNDISMSVPDLSCLSVLDSRIPNSMEVVEAASCPKPLNPAPFVNVRNRKGFKANTPSPSFITLRKRKGVTISVPDQINSDDPSSVSLEPINPSNCKSPRNTRISGGLNESTLLQAIPPSKTLFVSKLIKTVTPDDVLNHIRRQIAISDSLTNFNLEHIRCYKISNKNSYVSSFKISVPFDIFSYLLSPSVWPAHTFVKEFVPKNLRIRAAASHPISTPCSEVVLPSTPIVAPKN